MSPSTIYILSTMEAFINYIICMIIILTFVYYYSTWNYDYWSKRGVPCVKGVIPGVGNILPYVLLQENFAVLCEKFYNSMLDCSMVGFFYNRQPRLLLRDPELVKSVITTNFSSFAQNDWELERDYEPHLSTNPFFSSGAVWKKGRIKLINSFTTTKLKLLFTAVNQVCNEFSQYLEKKVVDNNGVAELELKSLLSRYTGEIVAKAGFGIEGHCFEENASPESFWKISLTVFNTSLITRLKQFLMFYFPQVLTIWNVRFFSRKAEVFIEKVVKDCVRSRKNGGFTRPDFLQTAIDQETTKVEGHEIVNEEAVIAHMISFFVDVYETSSVTLNFLLYVLSCHMDAQEKVRQEVQTVLKKYNGELNFDSLKDMTYMDQVISESMRLNPALNLYARVCTQEFELCGSDGISCKLKPGTRVCISIDGLHKDPNYWPDPLKFDPERFNKDKKESRPKFTYLPFGEGPRMCVGMRMALLLIKLGMASLLIKFSFEYSSKTRVPQKLDPMLFFVHAKGGLWAKVKCL